MKLCEELQNHIKLTNEKFEENRQKLQEFEITIN